MRQQRCHGAGGKRGIEDTGTHHGPAWLVVMDVCRVNDSYVQVRAARQQACRSSNTCSTATDNDHIVGNVGNLYWRFSTIDNAAHQALEVIPCAISRLDDARKWQICRISKCPHGGRSHTRATIGEYGLREFVHQLSEGSALLVAYLASLCRQIPRLQA